MRVARMRVARMGGPDEGARGSADRPRAMLVACVLAC